MPKISLEELDRIDDLITRNPRVALGVVRDLAQQCGEDLNFQRRMGGYLIDIGEALREIEVVQQGIDSILSVLSSDVRQRQYLCYNLANGYSSLENLSRRERPDSQHDPDSQHLLRAKQYYREALEALQLAPDRHDPNTRYFEAQIRINYGNCLSKIGRTLEAIAQYHTALEVYEDHPMASGNLAIELFKFRHIGGDPALLQDAYDLVNSALASDELEEIGVLGTRQRFLQIQQEIEKHLAYTTESEPFSENLHGALPPNIESYLHFCLKHELSLNFDLRRHSPEHPPRDSVSFSMMVNLEDRTTFPRLARIVNDIKEKYASARWLLFQVINPAVDTLSLDELTHYVDNLDYAVYGIQPGMLKIAFEAAFNVLDKIALFLNDYLELGMEPRRVNFTSIWRERGRGGRAVGPISDSIRRMRNFHAFALYDIARDLGEGGYLRRLQEIRNLSTHRYLVPHVERIEWIEDADGADYHMLFNELFDQTIELLQLVRAAIIYLVAMIAQREGEKFDALPEDAIVPPMLASTYRPIQISGDR